MKNIFLAGILAFTSTSIYALNPNETETAIYHIANNTSQTLNLQGYSQACSTINGFTIDSPIINVISAGLKIRNVISFDPNTSCAPKGYFKYVDNKSNGCVINFQGHGQSGNWDVVPLPPPGNSGAADYCFVDQLKSSKNDYWIVINPSTPMERAKK